MLKHLFIGMLEASFNYYGDSIGLAPIVLGQKKPKHELNNQFWLKECIARPNQIACLEYDL